MTAARQLAAILSIDIVAISRLTGEGSLGGRRVRVSERRRSRHPRRPLARQFWHGVDHAVRRSAPPVIWFHFRHGRSGAASSNRF